MDKLKTKLTGSNIRREEPEGETQAELAKQEQRVRELRAFFKEKTLPKRLASLNKSTAASIEGRRALADSLIELAKLLSLMKQDAKAEALGTCLQAVGEFMRDVEDKRNELASAFAREVYEPFNTFADELEEAEVTKKEHDKVTSNYSLARSKTSKLRVSKKLDQPKIFEAEKEEKACEKVYKESQEATLHSVQEMLRNNEKKLQAGLCTAYISQMHKYFLLGSVRLQELAKQLEQVQPQGVQIKVDTKDRAQTLQLRVPHTEEESAKDIKGKGKVRGSKDAAKPKANDEERLTRLKNMSKNEHKFMGYLDYIIINQNAITNAMKNDPKLADKINEFEKQTIFGEVNHLRELHSKLSELLEEAIKQHPKDNIGAGLTPLLPLWTSYINYTSNFSTAIDCLEKKMESKTFKSLLQGDLAFLLEQPVQRMDAWMKFIKSVLKTTAPDSDAYSALSTVFQSLKPIHEQVKSSRKYSENLSQLYAISRQLADYNGPNLAEPHRRLLREGPLQIIFPDAELPVGVAPGTRVSCKYYLFNDCLLYAMQESGNVQLGKLLNRSSKAKYLGRFSLKELQITDLADTSSLYNALLLGTGASTYTVILPTFADKKEWLADLRQAITSLTTSQVFGISLQALMQNNPKEAGRTIPRVVQVTVDELAAKALETHGLFRESGSSLDIERYKAIFDTGGDVTFGPTENEHNVSGLLKLWIRELPEPLLTYPLYDTWTALGSSLLREKEETGGIDQSLVAIKKAVEALPQENRFVLQALMQLLHAVSLHNDKNKMGPTNISIVFSPILLIKRGASPFDTTDFPFSNALTTALVQHYPAIFSDVEAERQAKEAQLQKQQDQ